MYEIEFIEREKRQARFLVRGVTPAFANGIRRAMIADVPTFSIDNLRVIENSSVLFDEIIGLRLGLVPLTTPLDEFDVGESVTLSIDVEGPATAYSGDLVTSEPMVEPAEEGVPIIELNEGQRLELEADAVLDTGTDHAKHQGGVSVGYRHLQRVEVVGDAAEFEEEQTQILRGVIEKDGEPVPMDQYDNDLTNVPEFEGKELEVHDVPNEFVFHVETDGSFTVEDLVVRAADSIESRAEELEEAMQL
jgi:DNA-directed RNA polymerase subunit D